MKIMDVVILVKYAQGLVSFKGYFKYVNGIMRRKNQYKSYLFQMAELTDNWQLQKSEVAEAIKESKLSENSELCQLLKDGVDKQKLLKIVELSDPDLKSSFKLLLTLFSVGYRKEFKVNMDAPDKFWYWDYLKIDSIMKIIALDYKEEIDVDLINGPGKIV